MKKNLPIAGKKMRFMKNKGFSLVEMVVVVLIMAVLAVALAPQVMKWVGNSRNSSDIQTRNRLTELCKLALTNEEAFAMVRDGEYELHVTKDSMGNVNFEYVDKDGSHDRDSVDVTDPYWSYFLYTAGADDFADFEEGVEIKSSPSNGYTEVSIDIKVYQMGFTLGELHGIENELLKLSEMNVGLLSL